VFWVIPTGRFESPPKSVEVCKNAHGFGAPLGALGKNLAIGFA
jgi:hypothetical protein